MGKRYGRRIWIFPDGDRPHEGDFMRKANETLVVLNTSSEPAHVDMTLYFTDKEPLRQKTFTVDPERVRCLLTNNISDMDGFLPEYREQYAIRLESSTEIVAQYLKVGTEKQSLHTYGMIGYSCDLTTKELEDNMQKSSVGRRVWVFTDGNRPPEGLYHEKGHESIIVLNMNDSPAEIKMTLFFPDKPPIQNKKLIVGSERVRCFRTGNATDMDGYVAPIDEKYSILLESNIDIVAQYGILDPVDQPLHMYTVMGYSCL